MFIYCMVFKNLDAIKNNKALFGSNVCTNIFPLQVILCAII